MTLTEFVIRAVIVTYIALTLTACLTVTAGLAWLARTGPDQ